MYNPLNLEEKDQIKYLWGEGLSALKISSALGRGQNSISNFLKREGIYERRYQPKRSLTLFQEKNLVSLYDKGFNCTDLANQFELSHAGIIKVLKRNGVKIRSSAESRKPIDRNGPKSNVWKGGRRQAHNGYILVYVAPNDPMRCMTNGNGSYVGEHRLVVARSIGRPLNSKESVHHLNGDKTDNRIENLQLRFGNHGRGKALCCGDCGSVNIKEVDL